MGEGDGEGGVEGERKSEIDIIERGREGGREEVGGGREREIQRGG